MTPEAQRIAIATACGWTCIQNIGTFPYGRAPGGAPLLPLPDFCNDLNAMALAEQVLTEDQGGEYEEAIVGSCQDALDNSGTNHWLRFKVCTATAAQRAESFLRTLNLWHHENRNSTR